jgi:putative oxidoreductase
VHANLPPWLAALAAYTEFLGGLLLVLGLLTPLTSLFLAGLMAGAFAFVHIPKQDPFVNPSGSSFESAALYLVLAIGFMLMGPGAYSLDALWMRRAERVETPEALVARRRGTA